jgi:hypothetical protein
MFIKNLQQQKFYQRPHLQQRLRADQKGRKSAGLYNFEGGYNYNIYMYNFH